MSEGQQNQTTAALSTGSGTAAGLSTLVRSWAESLRGTLGIVIGITITWEILARSGLFHRLLVPTVGEIVVEFWEMAQSGDLWLHVGASLARLFLGLAIAATLGITLGFLMAQFRFPEEILVPLVNFLLPIPSIALIPLFMLWFGLGNRSILPLVIFAATLPIAINTWRGIRGIKPIWLRAARGMGLSQLQLFRGVVIPGALPLIIVGLRLGFAQGWRSVIAGELVAAATTGLGVIIFRGKQFVNMPMMLAAVIIIGLLSQVFEKVIFTRLERVTVGRWGMLSDSQTT